MLGGGRGSSHPNTAALVGRRLYFGGDVVQEMIMYWRWVITDANGPKACLINQ